MWEAQADTGDIEAVAAKLMDKFGVQDGVLLTNLRRPVTEFTEAGLFRVAET